MSYQSRIFNFFTGYDRRSDVNKINGKGTLERFNEVVGKDIDDNLSPLIDNFPENVHGPNTVLAPFLPYLAAKYKFDTFVIGTDDATLWRKIVKNLEIWGKWRSTKPGMRMMFRAFGYELELTEFFNEGGFDSPLTFDDENRRFDSKCSGCSDYTIEITGVGIPGINEVALFSSIVNYHNPIDARLREFIHNGSSLPITYPDASNDHQYTIGRGSGDFNEDWSDDYAID